MLKCHKKAKIKHCRTSVCILDIDGIFNGRSVALYFCQQFRCFISNLSRKLNNFAQRRRKIHIR